MMTALRNNTKPIIWFTAIAFVVGFILILGTDVFFGSSAAPDMYAAKVNGQPISGEQWERALQDIYNSYRNQAGDNPDAATGIRLRAQAWEGLIQEILIAQEAKRMGIKITDQELAFAVRNQPLPEFVDHPAFQTDGRFDLAKYQQALASPNFNTLPLESYYRRTLPIQRVQERVLLSARVGEQELWEIYKRQNEKIRAELAQIPLGLVIVPESEQNPDDATLQSFLEEKRDLFRIEEQVELAFVRIPKVYSKEDSLESLETIRSAFEEYEDGEEFDVLVEAYSEAPPSRRGGDQGMLMQRQQFAIPALRDTAFAMEVGEVSGIITTAEGFHIIKLEEKTTEEGVEKVKIAEIFVPIQPSYETFAALRDTVLAFADSIRSVGFEAAAEDFGFATDSTGLFTRDGFPRGLGPVQEAIDFAFESAPGETSRPIETADAWYVVHSVRRLPPRDPELYEIIDRVRREWIQEKRRELGQKRAEALLSQVLAGKSLKEVAEADTLARYQEIGPITRSGFIPGVGSQPQLMGAIFGSDTTDAAKAVHTERGSFIFRILEKIPASEDDFSMQKEALRARVLQQRQSEVLTAWLEQLRKNAVIEDFRRTLVSL